MTKILPFKWLLFVGLLFSGGVVSAELVCDKPVYDFGERDEGSMVLHTFIVRNEGASSAIIERVKTTCGCTAATPSSKVVQPGATVEIKAAINLKKRTGLQSKNIYLYQKGKAQRLTLTLKGSSLARMEVKPKFIFFGNIDAGQPVTKTISIRSLRKPLSPSAPKSDTPLVACSTNPSPQENEIILTATLSTNAPAGRLRSIIRLPIFDGSENISIPVHAVIK